MKKWIYLKLQVVEVKKLEPVLDLLDSYMKRSPYASVRKSAEEIYKEIIYQINK